MTTTADTDQRALTGAALPRQAIAVREDNRDTVTANNLQEILDQTERRVWRHFENVQSA